MKAVMPPGVHYTGEIHVKLRETTPVARLAQAHGSRRRSLTAIARSGRGSLMNSWGCVLDVDSD